MFAKKYAVLALALGLIAPTSIAYAASQAEAPNADATVSAPSATETIVMDTVADDDFVWAPVERNTESYSYVTGQANGQAYADAEGDDDYEWTPVERNTESYGFQNGRSEAAARQDSMQ